MCIEVYDYMTFIGAGSSAASPHATDLGLPISGNLHMPTVEAWVEMKAALRGRARTCQRRMVDHAATRFW